MHPNTFVLVDILRKQLWYLKYFRDKHSKVSIVNNVTDPASLQNYLMFKIHSFETK